METIKNTELADVLKYGRSQLDQLVKRMAEKDPVGYSHPGMSPHRARVAAALQDNILRDLGLGKWQASLNREARDLFQANGMLYDQQAEAAAKATGKSVQSFKDTTVTGDIATIATQILPMITRAVAENPIFSLVDSIPMTGPQANIVYFNVKYGSTGGAYATGQRVDLNDDPNYSDRSSCLDSARELNMEVQKETTTATEKVLGGKICVTAMQDASSQYSIALDEVLGNEIQRQLNREWARLVTDDLRTMAGNTASWASTAPGPYSSLNTNEWRKVLVETMITLDAAIRTDVYEPSEWALSDITTGAILERVQRMHAPMATGNPKQGSIALGVGEVGSFVDRWAYYQDPFFAANTILLGRRRFNLVPHSPYYFLPYIFAANVSMLFYPLTQILEMAAQTRAARKMIEPNAFGRLSIT